MGRHSGAAEADIQRFEALLAQEPVEGSRRAARRAERLAQQQQVTESVVDDASSVTTGTDATQEAATDAQAAASNDESASAADAAVIEEEAAAAVDESAVEEPAVDQSAADNVTEKLEDEADGRDTAEIPVVTAAPRKFHLFARSRAAVVAVVAAAAGVGAVGASDGSLPASADTLHSNRASMASLSAPSTSTAAEVTFTVHVDGGDQEVTTSQPTLGGALAEANIAVDADDQVSQPLTDPVEDGAEVTINRVETKTISEDEVDKYQSSEVEDATLASGSTTVESEGVDGVTSNTYEVTYIDGEEVNRTLILSVKKTERVDEVVRVGSAETSTETAASSTDTSTSSASIAPAGEAQQIAYNMMSSYGWGDGEFSCLVSLWNRESNWNVTASNPSSGAYGIPQALPGSKMASAGSDWQTNAATQIKWGLSYISGRYGTPCSAWSHSQSTGWY